MVNCVKPPRLAVLIPAYNEAGTIADVAARALQHTDLVIVVNDGSTDSTSQTLEALPVTRIDNPVNLGKGRTLSLGAEYALARGVEQLITLDGDGQHRPEDIPLLLDKAAACPDSIIIAARLRDRHVAPPLRRFANGFADFWISWAAGLHIRDSQSGFRLYPAEVFRQCTTDSGGFVYESEILIDAARRGFPATSVAIDTLYHADSRPSHYRPAADTWAIVCMVAGKLISRGLYPLGLLRSLGLLKHCAAAKPRPGRRRRSEWLARAISLYYRR